MICLCLSLKASLKYMSAKCQHSFDGNTPQYRRIVFIVIMINALMFIIEIFAGYAANSQALKADALDFFGDTLTYAISLWAIGQTLQTRNRVAKFKAFTLLCLALWILCLTVYRFFFTVQPEAMTMSGIAILAFIANLISVILLMKFRDGDANIRSVWLCSRNDMINNVFVLIAGILVFYTHKAWPDLVVALIMSLLFASSAIEILRRSNEENQHCHD